MWNDEEGSPLEEPIPQGTEACEDSSLDSSLITRLVNDQFIKGVASVLAVDQNIVGMAQKLLEGGKSKHGTLDLDAWQYFTSLNIWRNDKLREYSTMTSTKQKLSDQQMEDLKARISDDPSLKPLLAGKQYIRVVLILVILSGSGDVSPPRAESSLGGLDDGTDSDTSSDFEMDSDMEILEKERLEMFPTCCIDAAFDDDHLRMILTCKSEKDKKYLTDEVMKDVNFCQLLLELVETVQNDSPVAALEHFDKVKEIWGNPKCIDLLLKIGYLPDKRPQTIADLRLSKYIKSRIKEDPLFETILKYEDPDFKTRVALSILIGFWSNQGYLLPFVCTMGGDALGVGKEESPRDWMSDTPTIMEFYRDKSIGELVDQLKEEPEVVKLAREYLKTLKLGDCYCSYQEHIDAATLFWCQPSVVLKFIHAMKKNPKLVEVLAKYSIGAETLRLQERMSHVRKDVDREMLRFGSDDSEKMRLGFCILIGYWVDRDVTQLYRTFCDIQRRTGKLDLLSDNKIVAFYYYARCATDLEGLESWVANKYGKGSHKALHLAKTIGDLQKEKCELAKVRGYRVGPMRIEVVLNGSSVFSWSLYWFDSSICTCEALHYSTLINSSLF